MARLTTLVGDVLSRAPQTRSERLIAGARVALAVVAIVAIRLDPQPLRQHVSLLAGSLLGYLIYALVVAAVVAQRPAPPPWLPLATQALDLATLPVLLYLTEAPASPFYLYLFFPLLSATLRWHLRGTLWTAALLFAVLLALWPWALRTLPAESLEPHRFLIRAAFLLVVALLLGALGAQEQALRKRLLRLARGPRSIALYPEELARDTLRQAAVLEAPRLVMTWEDSEEPWLNVASSAGGEVAVGRESPSTWSPLVAEPLAGAGFLCRDAGAGTPIVDRETTGRLERWRGAPLHRGFRERFAVGPVLSVPFRGAEVEGRLFWLDRPVMTADDLALGQVVAGQVAPLLDQFFLQRRLREADVAHERVRLAQDLHDGLLQSLAAAALQVESARAAVATDPVAASERLADVQKALAAEQRELRLFIRHMKPGAFRDEGPTAPLCERLQDLAARIGREWGFAIRVDHDGLRTSLDPALEQQTYLMVHEAVMNAARHAGATAVRVDLLTGDGFLRIAVEDDGRGFPFQGRHDAPALAASRQGPVSLRERVTMLGGSLVVESSAKGARVEIGLPLRAREA